MKFMYSDTVVKISRITFLVLFITGYLAAMSGHVSAQEVTGITVAPALIENRLNPGVVFPGVLRATNLSSQTQKFYVVKRDISGLTPRGTPIFAVEGQKTEYDISSWIKVFKNPIEIEPGKTENIEFIIEVPQSASPGSHFGALLLSLNPRRPEATGAGISYQVGTLINIQVAGEIIDEARIREFRTDQFIYKNPDTRFFVTVENLGNTVVRPTGPLEIFDIWGNKVATLRVNEDGGAIIPKSVREFEVAWKEDAIAFGRYQTMLSLVYGGDDRKTISDTLSFWILPIHIILPVMGAILLLIVSILIMIKLYIRRTLRKMQGNNFVALPQIASAVPDIGEGAISRLAIIAIFALLFSLVLAVVIFFLFA